MELLTCQMAAADVLGGLKECSDSARTEDAKLFALKFALYGIKAYENVEPHVL